MISLLRAEQTHRRILVTGGAGYIGSVLVHRLVAEGLSITILDRLVFGYHLQPHPLVTFVHGDIRDQSLLGQILPGHEAVIHLAGVSNDPKYEMDPQVGDVINWECFPLLYELSAQMGISRFIFASSCSVYGAQGLHNPLDEYFPVAPRTAYARLKLRCEEYMRENPRIGMIRTILRPGTVCGRSPRQRLDLLVNRMVSDAFISGRIIVSGSDCIRPGIHVDDLCDLYAELLRYPLEMIDGRTFNAAFENMTTLDLASLCRKIVGENVELVVGSSEDGRSYTICTDAVRELGFAPQRSAEIAITELTAAFRGGFFADVLTNPVYWNISMQKLHFCKGSS
jgi:nucleoside-diphosphate-sugar epimerase